MRKYAENKIYKYNKKNYLTQKITPTTTLYRFRSL